MSHVDAYSHLGVADLVERLGLINEALNRLGVAPLATATEGRALPRDNLAGMVAASADYLTACARKLSGSI